MQTGADYLFGTHQAACPGYDIAVDLFLGASQFLKLHPLRPVAIRIRNGSKIGRRLPLAWIERIVQRWITTVKAVT
jgi:hypothetical protein